MVGPGEEQPQTSFGAIGSVVAGVVGLALSAVFFPAGIVLGVLGVAVAWRALTLRPPDRTWWTAGLVLCGLALVASLLGAAAVLGRA